jgi:uncharacterized protein (DUF952 family)
MIYHIATAEDWSLALQNNDYICAGFYDEGFIHASYRDQLAGVVERYYKNRTGLMVLEIDELKLTAPLKKEASTNHELYPHIYGPINRSAVLNAVELDSFMDPHKK